MEFNIIVMCNMNGTEFPVRSFERGEDARDYIDKQPRLRSVLYYMDAVEHYSAEYIDGLKEQPDVAD